MPNILFILTDQQHLDTITAAGNPYLKTPALDRLKQRGTLFTESYCANPVCGPSRACLFSGRTASENGVIYNKLSYRPGIPTLGEWISDHSNYETIYVGKWHVPESYTNFIPGFEVLYTGIGGQGNFSDPAVARVCEAYLHQRTSDDPFFMVASFLNPHDICEWHFHNIYAPDTLKFSEIADELPPLPDNFDYDPREPGFLANYRKTIHSQPHLWSEDHWRYYIWTYYRHVEKVDAEIGRVLDAIERCGLLDDTVVIFTSDHGEGLGHHGNTHKNRLYEETLSVPLIVSWPGQLPEDVTDSTCLTTGLDIFPTVCDFAGVAPPENLKGHSLRPVLEGDADAGPGYVVCESNVNQGRMVRTADYKYVTYVDDPVDQLFDMEDDPGETRNLAPDPEYADRVVKHRDLLLEWEGQLDVAPDLYHADAWWRKG